MIDPGARGYHATYHEHETNHCPGCGRTQWIIGRVSAECAFCSTALPLDATLSQETEQPGFVTRGRGGGKVR